jgi:hypothetical protein
MEETRFHSALPFFGGMAPVQPQWKQKAFGQSIVFDSPSL